MTFDEYQAAALQTANPRLDLWYALAKLAAEGGEALQLLCKQEYQHGDHDASRHAAGAGGAGYVIGEDVLARMCRN